MRRLNEERKQLQPENQPSLVPEVEEMIETRAGITEEDSEMVMDTEDDDPAGPSLRGGANRALERKRRQEAEKERKEQAAKQPKGSKQYQRVLKKIEEEKNKIESCEAEIQVLDNDLREADCPRNRILGKDRFWNRYYWFERNAMPYEGLPNSSTATANYANGRLWVQGPDEMEREGFIDVPEELNKEYMQRFQTTVQQRKKAEEGPHGVRTAQEWGFYEDEEDLNKLIGWLDTRGNRESKLYKELQLQRNAVSKYMKNRKEYLTVSAEREDSEEPTLRMSTRTKTYIDNPKQRCLKWRNLTALRENGHLHIEADRPAKRQKKSNADSMQNIKPTNRQGKPLGRQGTK